MDLRHAAKDLGMAVYVLATDPGTIHPRLIKAVAKLAMLKPSDFPEDLAPQFASIYQAVPTGDEDRIATSANALTEEQAVDLARRIVALDLATWERLLTRA